MVDNFINGNLKDARRQARAYTARSIKEYLTVGWMWSADKAEKVTRYLKTGAGFQDACDAK